METILKVSKAKVYEEVAKTTEYTGAKMDDANAYEKISTTDEDAIMLERFWNESKNTICQSMKKVLQSEEESDGEYVLTLVLSSAFDASLKESMERSMFSYFVMNITAKWYTFANKSEATGYATEAATYIEDIMRKAYFKKKPSRPKYD